MVANPHLIEDPTPTTAQIQQFFDLIHSGRLDRDALQAMLDRYADESNPAEITSENIIAVPQESRTDFHTLRPAQQLTSWITIWKTIQLGTGLKDANAFLEALDSNGCKASNWGKKILGKPAFRVAKKKTEVDLVNLSVAELGFKDGATINDIYERAISLGLQLCPNEVGPQLRLQYRDQPKGEWVLVAMEPIADSDGSLSIFDVERDGGDLWLGAHDGSPDRFYGSYRRFVFVLPRK